jgi:hypothetical protein
MKVAAEEVGTWGLWGRQVYPHSLSSVRTDTMCWRPPDPQGNVPDVPMSPRGGNSMP